jgi:type II secretory ATPase GspE/PulE/Tfp pilus assembly ATPase PilB-like protein
MLDLGVEPYLVCSSILAVLAQRLVRNICPHCRESYVPDDELLADVGLKKSDLPGGVLLKGTGCKECMNIGYMGRSGLYEFFPLTEEIRAMILEHKSSGEMKKRAMARGLKTLRMDGGKKVLLGKTTLEEVLRVTQIDI